MRVKRRQLKEAEARLKDTAVEYLETEQIALLEKAAVIKDRRTGKWVPCLRDRLLVRMNFRLACRISELLGVAVDDIDFSRGTVTIEHLKAKLQLFCPICSARLGKTHVFCPRCGVKVERAVAQALEQPRMRTIPLDKDTLDLIKEYIKLGGPVKRDGRDYLFEISRFRARQIIMDCAFRAGLPMIINRETGRLHNVTPHKLRDAFAVNAMKADDSGDGQRMLQQHLGHARFDTTARYRKVAGKESREWYENLWA